MIQDSASTPEYQFWDIDAHLQVPYKKRVNIVSNVLNVYITFSETSSVYSGHSKGSYTLFL